MVESLIIPIGALEADTEAIQSTRTTIMTVKALSIATSMAIVDEEETRTMSTTTVVITITGIEEEEPTTITTLIAAVTTVKKITMITISGRLNTINIGEVMDRETGTGKWK